jgi:hypothetical protein
MGFLPRVLVFAVLLGATAPASAQYNVPSQATGDSSRMVLAKDEQQVIAIGAESKADLGYEFGASLDFLTRDRAPGEKALKFTDVVLFRVHGLLAIGKDGELFAGLDLLAKQPSYTNDLAWQGGLLGARMGFTPKLSGYVRVQGGPGLDRDGYWGMGEVALQSKIHLAEKVLFWDSTLGGTYTQLFPDEPVTKRFWLGELLAETGVAIRERKGFFAMWLTFSFHFPLVGRPEASSPDPDRGYIDPQTRVGVSLGVLAGVTKSLDFFVEASTHDRGDLEDPRTTLPILSGGFDQGRILFGFNKRFGTRRR